MTPDRLFQLAWIAAMFVATLMWMYAMLLYLL